MIPSNGQSNLMQALRQDPKKTAVLGSLAAILLFMGGRLMMSGGHPAIAVASFSVPNIAVTSSFTPSVPVKPYGTSASLRDWLIAPIPPVTRNMFLVNPEYFPRDGSKTVDETADGGFWGDMEKSLSLQADQRDKRQNLIDNFKVQAAAIRPQSTVMGANPRVMINGTLVAEGETVASFRVLKIQARGIIVEREGIRLEIPMK